MGVGDLKIYDADQVTINLAGIPIDSGYADGEFLSLEKVEDDFSTVVGTDGTVTRSKTNNQLWNVKIRLMQTSQGNDALSALRNADLLGQNGAGVGTILIRDRQGTTLYMGSKAWIQKPPDKSFDREAKERVWSLQAVFDIQVDGSN